MHENEIDVVKNFAVVMNAVIKRADCIFVFKFMANFSLPFASKAKI